MAEFVVRLADERGKVQEQTHSAATEEELRARFTQAGYYVYRSNRAACWRLRQGQEGQAGDISRLQPAVPHLIRAGLPILGSIECWPGARSSPLPRATGGRRDPRQERRIHLRGLRRAGGFPIVYTTTLLAGERSGNLEEVLQRYLDFQRVSSPSARSSSPASSIPPCWSSW